MTFITGPSAERKARTAMGSGGMSLKSRSIYFKLGHYYYYFLLRSTLGERFVIFGDPVVDGIPVHARREDSRFLVTWTGDVQNLRHFE